MPHADSTIQQPPELRLIVLPHLVLLETGSCYVVQAALELAL